MRRHHLHTTAIAAALFIVACGDDTPTAPTAPTPAVTVELAASASGGPAPVDANSGGGQFVAVALDPDAGDGFDFASDDLANDDFAIGDDAIRNSNDPNRPPTPGKPRNLRLSYVDDPGNTGRYRIEARWDDPASFAETPTHTQYALRGRDTAWRTLATKTNHLILNNERAGNYTFMVRWRIERDGYKVNGRMTVRPIDIESGNPTRKPFRPRGLSVTRFVANTRTINGRTWRAEPVSLGWYRATGDEKTGLVDSYRLDGWPEFARGADMFSMGDGLSQTPHHSGAFNAMQTTQVWLTEGEWTLAVVAVNGVGRSPAATVGHTARPSGITTPRGVTNLAATPRGPVKSNGLRRYRITFGPPAAPNGFGGGPLHRFELFWGATCLSYQTRVPQPLLGEERYQPKNEYWFEREVRPGRQMSVRAANSAGGGSCSTVRLP